ncbi:hypothetical protein FSP39_005257 [Pinctada imbricata]|uniref:Uncharacterized protein n=1 Tax=Pinctada imbricata TaxID=66713 RepID=A0AA89BQG0_PINIB|nr:hypothetical protein FSP39_005257 [Pinctada imbricata]
MGKWLIENIFCIERLHRQIVADILRELDPEGVQGRTRHRFSRRSYVNKGPNYLIHLDWYDKLKQFWFPIHGAVDGECARFCFMDILHEELDCVRMEWNQHRVRASRNSESPAGKPDMLFYLPNLFGD